MHEDFLQRLPADAVLIHGGLHKTGSSAIQNTLAEHPEALAAAGWLYPKAGRIQESETGQRHRQLMTELRKPQGDPCWSALRTELAGWPGRVLLSHENFFSPQIQPERVAEQLPGRDIYVLAYLRHPVDYIESCYREWVRRWKYLHPVSRFYRTRSDYLDVAAQRQAWENVVGTGHVLLRPYDRSHFTGGSVLTDFLNVLGLPMHLTPPPGGGNESLNAMQTLVGLVANRLAVDATRRNDLIALLDDSSEAAALRESMPVLDFEDEDDPSTALRRVLSRPLKRTRLVSDRLAAEITQLHMDVMRSELVAQGASSDVFTHSTLAGLPVETGVDDVELRQTLEQVLAPAETLAATLARNRVASTASPMRAPVGVPVIVSQPARSRPSAPGM